MDMPIIVNDNGDISFFANIKDAELYLEPDDIKQNFYEIFNIMRSQFLFDKFTNYFFLTIKNDCYNYWSFTHR